MKQLVAGFLGIVAWASAATGARADVPDVHDLQKDGEAARAINGAVLVVFVGEHCGYCQRVLKEFLIPMSGNTTYKEKVVMRRLEISADDDIRDFGGQRVSPRKFANRFSYRMVPTVMLFDSKGRLLAKPLVGLTTVDYYGMYLDEAIDTAIAKVRGPAEGQPKTGT